MKILTTILLVLSLTLCVFAQEPEKKIYKFPESFSPDGKIGSANLVVFGGKLQQSNDYAGYAVSGRLEYILDKSVTIFLGVDYQHLSYNGSSLLMNSGFNSTLYGGGFKIFGGM